MSDNVYLLLIDSDESLPEVIHSGAGSLKVNIFKTDKISFNANEDEVQLYAVVDGNLLAFETDRVNEDDILDFVSAIKWYLNYIGSAEAEILPEAPRLGKGIAV